MNAVNRSRFYRLLRNALAVSVLSGLAGAISLAQEPGPANAEETPGAGAEEAGAEPAAPDGSQAAPNERNPDSEGVKEETEPERSVIMPLDSETLPALLKEKGFEPPDTFKALIIEIVGNEKKGFVYHPFDYKGTSSDRENWWPASTVKLYAAIAALEKVRALGYPTAANVTFDYPEKPVTRQLARIVRSAITQSNNISYDQLVEIVGFEEMNERFLSEKNGLPGAVLLRAYASRVTYPDTGKGSNRHSSKITLTYKGRTKVMPERNGKGEHDCPDQGNCTTLQELTEAMRRVMMHEHLPETEQYGLGKRELRLLRAAMAGKRKREGGISEGLRAAFEGRPIEIYHKGGYAYQWFTDNLFLRVRDTKQRWIVTMTNHPGREALDEAGRVVADLIKSGALSRARKKAARHLRRR